MNRWAEAGARSASRLTTPCACRSFCCCARASHFGWPQISAAVRSAEYSRVREIAICTCFAASGARIMIANVPTSPSGLRL
jgi:hypothetical protein